MSGAKPGGSARKILGRDARARSLTRGSRQVQPGTDAENSGAPPEPVLAPTAVRRGRENTKRITVDLSRDQHKFLRDYTYDNDTDGMRVVRALLLELRDDPELSERVLSRLATLETR